MILYRHIFLVTLQSVGREIVFLFRFYIDEMVHLRRIKQMSIVITMLLLLSSLCVQAADDGGTMWRADNVPMVHLKDRTQYVCDPENILSGAARDSANIYLSALEHKFGIQSVFVIVNNVLDKDVFRMAQDIGNNYGVGDKDTRRGLVVVVAVADHKYFIAPGKGLEGELTDVECNNIGRACIQRNMRNGLPDSAVVATCKAFYNKFSTGKTGIKDEMANGGDDDRVSWTMLLFLFIFFCLPVLQLISWVLTLFGLKKPSKNNHRRKNNDGWPPFFFGGGGFGGGSGGGGFSGGSFGGGSFGGGGAGGGW
jgi:uncharacterized protein